MSLPKISPYVDNFVSQDQIDTLLKGKGEYAFPDGEDPLGDIADFINTDEIDSLLSDDEPEDAPKSNREDEMTDELLPEDDGVEDEELSMISMDDIQRVLSEDGPGASKEASTDALSLEEIPGGSVGEAAEVEDDLISQDDIDRLLKNSGVDAEESFREEDEGFQISQEEIETILTDTLEDPPEIRAEEKSESSGDAPAEKAKEAEFPLETTRSKKKLILMAAGVALFFIFGGGVGWFLLMDGDEPPLSVEEMADSGGPGKTTALPVQGTPGEPQVVSRLDNFLIPAADGNDYAFVSTHVVITIRGVKKDPLAGYETFYRKRIYDELAAKLASVSGEKPVERELRELVRKTTGVLLTEGVIDEVVLEGYRLM